MRNFWLDFALAVVLALLVLTPIPEHLIPFPIHTLAGLGLVLGVCIHLTWHRKWIGNVLHRFQSLSVPIRRSAVQSLMLFSAYTTSGLLGLTARLAGMISFHAHIFFVALHIFTSLIVLVLQAIHLLEHRKWIATSIQRVFRTGKMDRMVIEI